jgi:hypothetical protein
MGNLSREESITGVARPSDTELLRRAITYVKAPMGTFGQSRWSCVASMLQVGSTTAIILCREAGVDPDEPLDGGMCEVCPFGEEYMEMTPLREQIEALIAESEGVTGLHLNGDIALWDWLIDNEWLSALKEE